MIRKNSESFGGRHSGKDNTVRMKQGSQVTELQIQLPGMAQNSWLIHSDTRFLEDEGESWKIFIKQCIHRIHSN